MESTTVHKTFSARPNRLLRANAAMLSTTGPTGTAAILDSVRGQFYSLNEVGARVWSLLNQGTTFDGIVAQLHDEYDVTTEALVVDVEELLQQFAKTGLLGTEGGVHDER